MEKLSGKWNTLLDAGTFYSGQNTEEPFGKAINSKQREHKKTIKDGTFHAFLAKKAGGIIDTRDDHDDHDGDDRGG